MRAAVCVSLVTGIFGGLAACTGGGEPTTSVAEQELHWECSEPMYTWQSPWGYIGAVSNGDCTAINGCDCPYPADRENPLNYNDYGETWQCAELVNRFFLGTTIFPGTGKTRFTTDGQRFWLSGNAGQEQCDSARSKADYIVYDATHNPNGTMPVPGDALEFTYDGGGTHTGVVTAVNGTTMTMLQQNSLSGNNPPYQAPIAYIEWNTATLSFPHMTCFIHPIPGGAPSSGGGGGVIVNPPVNTAPCPSAWVGWVCWSVQGMTGATPLTLYHCNGPNAAPTATACRNGCQVMPPGVDDQCYQGLAPCHAGWVGGNCGSAIGGDVNTLYHCNGNNLPTVTYCPRGCHIAAPGVDDYCN